MEDDFALRYARIYPGVNSRAELVTLAQGLSPERRFDSRRWPGDKYSIWRPSTLCERKNYVICFDYRKMTLIIIIIIIIKFTLSSIDS